MRAIRNLLGYTNGKIKVVSFWGTEKRKAYWNCECECGRTFKLWMGEIITNGRTSCGKCRRFKTRATHMQADSTEYKSWSAMKGRCLNESDKAYDSYGGRGIKVCERWLVFENFIADMGKKPSPSHSLERMDNDGNYEPGNCKWATRIEQCNNRRSTRLIEYNGLLKTLRAWCDELKLPFNRTNRRLYDGWPVNKAFDSREYTTSSTPKYSHNPGTN